MRNQLLIELHKHPQTVFTVKEMSLIMPDLKYANLISRLAYLATQGAIRRLARGIYAKENYEPLELANKLYTPSYVSLETVLRQAGIIFQHYEQIISVSYLTRTLQVDSHTFLYHKMTRKVLLDKRGLTEQGHVAIALPERAFLDAVYLYRDYYFDNLGALNWDQVFDLQGLYRSKALEKRVKDIHQIYKGEQ